MSKKIRIILLVEGGVIQGIRVPKGIDLYAVVADEDEYKENGMGWKARMARIKELTKGMKGAGDWGFDMPWDKEKEEEA